MGFKDGKLVWRVASDAAAETRKPLARADDLVIESLEDEVLVYDRRSDQAHCLSAQAARVWRACDGATSLVAMREALGLDADAVGRALQELAECDLLDAPVAGVSRREAAARIAKYGAAVASAPLIYSIVAPTPALAASEKFCEHAGCVGNCASCFTGCSCCHGSDSSQKVCVADCKANCNQATFTAVCGGTLGNNCN